MWTQTLALMTRSLRAEVRDVRIHLFRLAVVAIVIVILMTTMAGSIIVGAPGLRYFALLARCNFWFITFAGASFFAACIAEEREEGTLGLLKMAGLGPVSILAGKALPLLIGAVLLLSIQYPFTVLAITLGGVTWNQVVGAYVCLLAHLMLVAGFSVLISVVSRRTAAACGRAAIFWFGLIVGSWAVSQLTSVPAPTSPVARWLVSSLKSGNDWLLENYAYYQIGAVLSIGPAGEILSRQVVSNSLLGLVFATVAALIFDRATANEVESTQASWWRRVIRRKGTRHRAWRVAIVGKEFTFLTGGRLALLTRALVFPPLAASLAWASHGFDWSRLNSSGDLPSCLFWTGLSVMGIEAAINTARVFRSETAGRTWSSLCMLPRSAGSIAAAKVLGASIALLPAALLAVISMPSISDDPMLRELSKRDGNTAFVCLLIMQVVLGIHLAALLSVTLRWAVWPVALFLATFCEVIGVILFVLILSDVLKYPGPNSCPGVLWTAVVLSIAAVPLAQSVIVRRLRRAAATD